MITVEEIKKKAENKYLDFLKYKASEVFQEAGSKSLDNFVPFFPLAIKADRGKASDDLLQREKELTPLIKNSKTEKGFGYELFFEEKKTRENGNQSVISKIAFSTEKDYLRFIKKETETKSFCFALEVLKGSKILNNADLLEWAKCHSTDLVLAHNEEQDYWKNICLCALYLKKNCNTNLYLRELPIPVHTKFIENNKRLIHSLISNEKIKTTFEGFYGLKEKPSLVRFRFLFENKNLAFEGLKLSEVQLTLEDFKKLEKTNLLTKVKTVLVVENEIVYLTFPKTEGALCIWGQGFKASSLKSCLWLNNLDLQYFGDLDEHGFEILSEFRAAFPCVKSFCMDLDTLREFSNFRCKGKTLSSNTTLQNLTKEEQEVFDALRKEPEKNRLEQEHILQEWIKKKLGMEK